MSPDQYRAHPSGALRRAFFRGADAFRAGAQLVDNPYRHVKTIRRARRGSWSEAYTRAWAVGWRDAQSSPGAHLAGLSGLSAVPGGLA
jgi:hypothetical protein